MPICLIFICTCSVSTERLAGIKSKSRVAQALTYLTIQYLNLSQTGKRDLKQICAQSSMQQITEQTVDMNLALFCFNSTDRLAVDQCLVCHMEIPKTAWSQIDGRKPVIAWIKRLKSCFVFNILYYCFLITFSISLKENTFSLQRKGSNLWAVIFFNEKRRMEIHWSKIWVLWHIQKTKEYLCFALYSLAI